METRWPSWDEIISRYGLSLTSQGGQFRGACPLHGGTNPTAFVVNPERGFFCHACGRGGGVGTFLRLMGGGAEPGRAAARHLVRPQAGQHASIRARLDDLDHDRLRALANVAEVDPIYPRDPEHPYFRARGISSATVASVGGGVHRGAGPFFRRAVFPVWTPEGRLVGHVGRAIDAGNAPRYLCQKGLRKALLLYNETEAMATASGDTVIVVEGVFDVLAVIEAGFPNVVALIGCMASPFQLAALSHYRHVLSLLDGDDAGREGATRLRSVLGERVTLIELKDGDPGQREREALRVILERAGLVPAG